jgi:hypothetical protein
MEATSSHDSTFRQEGEQICGAKTRGVKELKKPNHLSAYTPQGQ